MPQVDLTAVVDPATEVLEWKEYVSQNPGFKVMLPAIPQHAVETVPMTSTPGSMKYNLYLAQSHSGSTYMISVIEYPEGVDLSNAKDILDGVQKEMLSANEKNTLASASHGTFMGSPSLEFKLLSPEIVTKTIAFLKEHRLYVLTVVDHVKSEIDQHFDTFTSSFQTTVDVVEK